MGAGRCRCCRQDLVEVRQCHIVSLAKGESNHAISNSLCRGSRVQFTIKLRMRTGKKTLQHSNNDDALPQHNPVLYRLHSRRAMEVGGKKRV